MKKAIIAVLLVCSFHVLEAANAKATAEALLSFENLRPGFCVYIGSSDAAVPVELAAGNYHVQCLTPDQASVEKMRDYVDSKALYGKVVVNQCSLEYLPYPTNLINVLVVEDYAALQEKGITVQEIMRVVAPYSSAILGNAPSDLKQVFTATGFKDTVINKKEIWTQIIKPWPDEMDEWPQPDHDAGCASISSDTLVRPSNSLQWIAGFPAQHDGGALNPLLTVNGRIFTSSSYEGIVARDAFNGQKLWQRDGASVLIADKDRLFVRLEKLGPITGLDAATGKTIRSYNFGGATKSWPPLSRLAYADGILLTGIREVIEAYDTETGEQLWKKRIAGEKGGGASKLDLFQDINKKRIIGEGKVFLTLTGTKQFLCLDLKTGEELWRVSNDGDRFVCYRQGILFSQRLLKGTNNKEVVFNAVYSPEDGKQLWRYDYTKVWHSGHPHNVFLLNGLVWVLTSVEEENVSWTKAAQAWHALNPKTGEVVRRIDWKNVKHRCFGDRATEQYIIAGGMDFLDVKTGDHYRFLGGRGNCAFGRMPANGLIYEAPNTCQCYPQVRGFNAFTSDASVADGKEEGQVNLFHIAGTGKPADEEPSSEDWPMLRRDPGRNAGTETELPKELTAVWEKDVVGRLSSPVAACGKVYVSSIDDHRVIALDMKTGSEVWSFRANGRVDSPPTIYKGMALFGCSDGWVYSLSSAKGELIWSLRAAPKERWLMCREQVESAWPVHGSVLVENDTVFFSAGRHSHVDGGIFLFAVSPKTGELLWQKRHGVPSLPVGQGVSGPTFINDIMVSSGGTLFVHKAAFDPATGAAVRKRVPFWSGSGGGFLTDTFHLLHGGHDMYRTWKYSEHGVSGLALASAGERVFGVASSKGGFSWNTADGLIVFGRPQKGKKHTAWQVALPKEIIPKAILPSGDKLYVAAVNQEEETSKGIVLIYNANDGKSLSSIPVNLIPRFDGMAVVKDHLIVTSQDGKVICLGKK